MLVLAVMVHMLKYALMGGGPQASSAWRPAQGRGTRGTKPSPFARPRPPVRRLYALLSATIPWTPSRPRARHSAIATGVSPLSLV